MLVISAPVSEP